LFVGTRTDFDQAESGLAEVQIGEALGTKTPRALSASAWLNGEDPLSLDQLKGRVVLLYFWADSCKDSVNRLAQVEQLYAQFKERGLVVIGIHAADQSDSASQTVKDHIITFPVMVDDGQTAKGYRVDALPSCFLIDKTGKVVWGFGMAPPTDTRIEELLK
jgi:peroxiredoxin